MPRPKETKRVSANGLNPLMKRYFEVQLATLVDTPPEGAQWLHEIKFDGYRLLGYVSGGASRLLTRNGKDWTNHFPSLSAAIEKLPVKNPVLDMEAVVLDEDGKSSFQSLQAALGEAGNRDSIGAYVFDLLHIDGTDFTQKPLLERKERLQTLLKSNKLPLRYSGHVRGQGAEMFAKACETGLEGILSKQAHAPYVAGRQRSWLKIKCSRRQEFIIVGLSDARKGERALGALYLAYKKNGVLQYAGKVGTGFSMQSARELAGRLAKIGVKTPVLDRGETVGLAAGEWRAVHWVEPVLLCEVAFTEWTGDGHIRHPSFQGLREDKDASQVNKEQPMRTSTTTKSTTGKKEPESLVLGGISITHPGRVISETGHITKGELAEYYAGVASWILPQIERRPLSLLRCPSGIDKQCFFQRTPAAA